MISEDKQIEICKKAIRTFGEHNQMVKAIEECGELIQALSRVIIDQDPDLDNVAEEIADVEILICQLKQIDNISEKLIQDWKAKKLKKLNEVVW